MPGATLFVCTTCRGADRAEGGGAALAAAVERLAPAHAAVAVVPFACLWSCAHGASAQVHGPGKTGYVLGGLGAGDAGALLDFAAAHAACPDGEVPYADWPAGVLGRFLARVPAGAGGGG